MQVKAVIDRVSCIHLFRLQSVESLIAALHYNYFRCLLLLGNPFFMERQRERELSWYSKMFLHMLAYIKQFLISLQFHVPFQFHQRLIRHSKNCYQPRRKAVLCMTRSTSFKYHSIISYSLSYLFIYCFFLPALGYLLFRVGISEIPIELIHTGSIQIDILL